MTVQDFCDRIPKTQERIRQLAEKWIDAMGLKWWLLHLVYDAERDPESPKCAARCLVSWEYCEATVTFFLPICADLDDDEELERIIVHEFCHILVNEMRMWGPPAHRDEQAHDEAMKHEERVVTTLAKAFLWVRDAAKRGDP